MILVLLAVAAVVLPGSEAVAHAQFDSPAAQQRSGVESGDVRCNEGLFLVVRSGDRAACVRESTAQRLGLEIVTAQNMRAPYTTPDPGGAAPPVKAADSPAADDAGTPGGSNAGHASVGTAVTDAPEPHATPKMPHMDNLTIPRDMADANNAFATDLYRQVSDSEEHGDKNIFFSPASIYVAFSVLYEGAREDTAVQMRQVFGFEPDAAARHNITAHTLASLNREDPHATLDMANALWMAAWFTPYDSYLETARTIYLATAETVKFTAEDGVKRINEWASENTRGKIDEVVRPEDVSPGLTAMVITNAIYFKGTWLTQFPEEGTTASTFYKTGTESVSTDFMKVHGMFDYAHSDGAQVVRLPYKGDRISMLVVLPDGTEGIKRLDDTVSADRIARWMDLLTNQEVTVSLPKFETKTKYALSGYLAAMGMPDVFSKERADLLGIAPIVSSEQNPYVSEALHDAYVKVNEEGTEAAAVTSIMIFSESIPPPPPHFNADHPFMFIIYDEESGAILFMGRVMDPTA